jgi:GR25 family glycosyltransferase involved in LPS biosynthesis
LHISYINLDSRPDRNQQISGRFRELNLSAERIIAVTPDDLSEADKMACERSYGTDDPIIAAELCCNLSHKRAMETFLSSGADYGAIFEDDALMADDLPELLAQIDAEGMPCDILKLETYIDRTQYGVRPIRRYGQYGVHSMHSYTWGCAGYVMSRKAAERYLETSQMMWITTDRAMWRRFPNKTGAKVLQLVPAPVVQYGQLVGDNDATSNIGPTRGTVYQQIVASERVWSKIRRFCRDEFTIALPALLHRALKRSVRGSIPFTGELPHIPTPKDGTK